MTPTRRTVIAGTVATALSAAAPASAGAATGFPEGFSASATQPSRASRLSNLAHLDFLRAEVVPPPASGHATYGSGPLGVLWTYADHQPDGSYRRIGGGVYDPVTDTYGQGAYNADDIARACVVYLRHWTQFREPASLDAARGLLRALTFLQSPNGNVVLWMQPDGTLNPSAKRARGMVLTGGGGRWVACPSGNGFEPAGSGYGR